MITNNYFQTIEPDYYIKIGIKDNKIVNIDWSDLSNTLIIDNPKEEIISYLKDCINLLKNNE